MKILSRVVTAVAVVALSAGMALAEGRGDDDKHHNRRYDERQVPQRYEQHHEENRYWRQGENHEWRRGEYVDRDEWRRSRYVEWREYHLTAPPRGYEWREFDGRYILAAIATGIVADIIINVR